MKTKFYKTVIVCGHEHVICDIGMRNNSLFNQPNYQNTGWALCGVLREKETLNQWKMRTHR